jgi:molybdopterin-guanine dinucleotide biosynthesis protein A
MDIQFLKTVLTAPGDHPHWETDLLAKLADVPSREAAAGCIAPAPRPAGSPLFATPPRARR